MVAIEEHVGDHAPMYSRRPHHVAKLAAVNRALAAAVKEVMDDVYTEKSYAVDISDPTTELQDVAMDGNCLYAAIGCRDGDLDGFKLKKQAAVVIREEQDTRVPGTNTT